jgi:hypothetical protein
MVLIDSAYSALPGGVIFCQTQQKTKQKNASPTTCRLRRFTARCSLTMAAEETRRLRHLRQPPLFAIAKQQCSPASQGEGVP